MTQNPAQSHIQTPTAIEITNPVPSPQRASTALPGGTTGQPLSNSNRTHQVDKKVNADISGGVFPNTLFIRLTAKEKHFTRVDFKYSIFDTCYLRACVFDSCDFTGCRFIATTLHGSSFTGCKFDYAIFERTIVDNDVLAAGCPGHENLKMRFARTLRTNYQQLGDARSVNKAIDVELDAMGIYLYKAWHSNESYYRKKYTSWKRVNKFLEWLSFRTLGFIWGNGESAIKLLRTAALMLICVSLIDAIAFKDCTRIASYFVAASQAPQLFLGTLAPSAYPSGYLAVLALARLVTLALFMSILIKRFNRR